MLGIKLKHSFVLIQGKGIKLYKVNCSMNQGYDYDIEITGETDWNQVCPFCKEKINFPD
jgi:hypothetical protein